jgi:hypothetical protein
MTLALVHICLQVILHTRSVTGSQTTESPVAALPASSVTSVGAKTLNTRLKSEGISGTRRSVIMSEATDCASDVSEALQANTSTLAYLVLGEPGKEVQEDGSGNECGGNER